MAILNRTQFKAFFIGEIPYFHVIYITITAIKKSWIPTLFQVYITFYIFLIK